MRDVPRIPHLRDIAGNLMRILGDDSSSARKDKYFFPSLRMALDVRWSGRKKGSSDSERTRSRDVDSDGSHSQRRLQEHYYVHTRLFFLKQCVEKTEIQATLLDCGCAPVAPASSISAVLLLPRRDWRCSRRSQRGISPRIPRHSSNFSFSSLRLIDVCPRRSFEPRNWFVGSHSVS